MKAWFTAALVRALKTAAETAIGVIGATYFFDEVNWAACGMAVALATVLSLLWSIKGIPEVNDGAPPLKQSSTGREGTD